MFCRIICAIHSYFQYCKLLEKWDIDSSHVLKSPPQIGLFIWILCMVSKMIRNIEIICRIQRLSQRNGYILFPANEACRSDLGILFYFYEKFVFLERFYKLQPKVRRLPNVTLWGKNRITIIITICKNISSKKFLNMFSLPLQKPSNI